MQTLDITDERGFKRRVCVPDDADANPAEGIPISLDVGVLYPNMPASFAITLNNELWERGLIEPRDFLAPGAAERIRSVLLSVAKRDALDIIAFAKEQAR